MNLQQFATSASVQMRFTVEVEKVSELPMPGVRFALHWHYKRYSRSQGQKKERGKTSKKATYFFRLIAVRFKRRWIA